MQIYYHGNLQIILRSSWLKHAPLLLIHSPWLSLDERSTTHIFQASIAADYLTGLHTCFLQNGLICTTYKDSTTQLEHTQVVILANLKNTVLQKVHNNLGHLRVKKTLEGLQTRYYTDHNMSKILSSGWINTSMQCEKCKLPQPNPEAPLGSIAAVCPFEKLSLNIMGPFPTSSHGNKYILVITDCLLNAWVEAFSP